MFTIQIPRHGKYETRHVEMISKHDIITLLEQLDGVRDDPICFNPNGDSESGLSILGGLDGQYVCEWITIDGGSLLLKDGCQAASNHEVQVCGTDCCWYPVETVVDASMAADVILAMFKVKAQPLEFAWWT